MTGSRRESPVPRDPGKSTGPVLLSGLAWGALVTTFESLAQPPLELGPADFVTFYSRVLLHYSAGGLLLAWLTSRISVSPGRLIWTATVPVIVAAMGLTLLIDQLSIRLVPLWRNDQMAAMAPRLFDLAAHMAWIFAIYGGLYMTVFFLLRREALSREHLRKAELARLSAEARVERAATEHSPIVAPDLLVRALSELARRFSEDHRRANRLLDMLVRLLRSASSAGPDPVSARAVLAASLHQLKRELGAPGDEIAIENVQRQEAEP